MDIYPVIVLTGGPCGGKTTLIDELSHDPTWVGRFAALPEAIFTLRNINISPQERLFQRVMVQMQIALEDGLKHALEDEGPRLILCHRGSMDPLAYWLDRGWPEGEFFEYTETSWEMLFRRYSAVIHLVTAADGAIEHYKKYPQAHRPETPQQAIQLDRLLQRVWSKHPRYFRIDNDGRDWSVKAGKAQKILAQLYDEI